jgi:peptidoglycan/xylan/chitin deacetylase (PgdA/CDA1 family)
MTMLSTIKNTIRNFISPKAMILVYHQVCERKSDPWQLAVSPDNFDQQLEVISKDYNVVPLDEMVSAIKQKKLHNRMLSITFDDGFLDNYLNAKPRLKAINLPATFYCTTYAALRKNCYWWEELESLILHTETLPSSLEIEIGDKLIRFKFDRDASLTDSKKNQMRLWTVELPPCNERVQLMMDLWKAIQPLPFDDQLRVLENLRSWTNTNTNASSPCYQVMSAEQIADIAKDPLFAIGGHSVHHAMLAEQQVETQAYEIRECKSTLENWLNRSVTAFAYPYGNYNSTTKILLRDAGFKYAVSTESRMVTESDDLFALPRIHVNNWNKREFESRFQKIAAS